MATTSKLPRVVIEVSGGVAELTEGGHQADVTIIDWDEIECLNEVQLAEYVDGMDDDLKARVLESRK